MSASSGSVSASVVSTSPSNNENIALRSELVVQVAGRHTLFGLEEHEVRLFGAGKTAEDIRAARLIAAHAKPSIGLGRALGFAENLFGLLVPADVVEGEPEHEPRVRNPARVRLRHARGAGQ